MLYQAHIEMLPPGELLAVVRMFEAENRGKLLLSDVHEDYVLASYSQG